jgi:CubicO group peptidase (beta-lactamase class C family)
MQLVEEEKLSLDDTIDTWFPEQPNGDRITIRMLLSHTSGLHTYINGPQHIVEMKEGKFSNYWAPMDMVAKANKHGPVGEPGSSEGHYSNTNFVLLGLIVEEVTGNSWAQEVESRIIKSLGLKDTTFLSKEGILDIMVGGYTKTEDGYINLLEESWYPHPSTVWSAGEIVTTVSDLMTFAGALFDGKLVSKETLAVMAQPLGTDIDSGILWGLGGGTLEMLPPGAFGMGGDIPGYHAFFIGFLDNKLIVTALCNTEEGNVMMPSLSALQYISQSLSGAPDEEVPVGNVYTDPEGRFSIPLVGEWTQVETDGTYALLELNGLPINMYIVTVESDNLEAGMDAALRQIDIDPAALTLQDTGKFGNWNIFYHSLGDGKGVTILAQIKDETIYCLIGTGDEALTMNPPDNLVKTAGGFTLAGEEVILPTTVQEFESYMATVVGDKPPALSIAIALGGDVIYAKGFGMADGPKGIAAAPDTVYQWGSTSKIVSATCIMQLYEKGLVDLDAPVSRYLDYFPTEYPITVRQVLSHSSGLPEPTDYIPLNLRLEGQSLPDPDLWARKYLDELTGLIFEPGSASAYSSPNSVLVGQIVAEVSGKSYIEYARENILIPLGMKTTDFTYSSQAMISKAAAGAFSPDEVEGFIAMLDGIRGRGDGADFIREVDGNLAWMNRIHVFAPAGGGLIGPVTEVIRFLGMHLNGGEFEGVRILSPESVSLMQEMQISTKGTPLGFGLGWEVFDQTEHPHAQHPGGGVGIQTLMRLYPNEGLAITIMSNLQGYDHVQVVDAAANVLFSMMAGQ